MKSSIISEIIEIIPKIYHPKKDKITKETELEHDLGITGDDAEEFLMKFSDRFNVNIEHFKFGDYFAAEGEYPFQILLSWLFGKKLSKNGRKRLTIGDLENGVKNKRLF